MLSLKSEAVSGGDPGLGSVSTDGHEVLSELREFSAVVEVPEDGGEPFHVFKTVGLESSEFRVGRSCLRTGRSTSALNLLIRLRL